MVAENLAVVLLKFRNVIVGLDALWVVVLGVIVLVVEDMFGKITELDWVEVHEGN